MAKQMVLIALFVSAGNVAAQGPADQQQFMQQMQEMQSCMMSVDQAAMKQFEGQARKAEAEIRGLCAQGNRGAAQDAATTFGKQVMANAEVNKMRICMEPMMDMMPVKPYFGPEQGSPAHVCDQMR